MSTSHPSSGQSSLEFIVMITLLMMIFAAFVSVFVDKQVSAVEKERETIATTVADSVGFELDRALVEGEGYSRKVDLVSTIRGEDYNITLSNGTVIVDYRGRSVRGYTAAENVSGSFEPGMNRVENRGYDIHVSQP